MLDAASGRASLMGCWLATQVALWQVAPVQALPLAASNTTPSATAATPNVPASASPAESSSAANATPKKVRLVFAGVRGAMKDNVSRSVRLRALIRRDDASDALIERAYRQAPNQIRAALAPFGHDQPQIEGSIRKEGDTWRIRFQIDPGPATVVGTLAVEVGGAAATDAVVQRAVQGFQPGLGASFVHADYEAGKAELVRLLQSRGYFESRLVESRVEIRRSAASAAVRLQWDSGPRYRFGPLQFEGSHLDEALLQRYRSFREGAPYDQNQLLELQQRLTDADYFSVIEVSVEPEAAVDGAVPVRVRLEPAPQSIYTGGLSFGTDSGAGVSGGVERRYLNRWGHKGLANAEYAQNLQAATLSWRVPRYDDHRSYYGATAQLRNQQTDRYESDTLRLSVEDVRLRGGWEQRASLTLLDGDFTLGGRREEGGEAGSSTLLFPELRLSRREADNLAAPRHGWSAVLYLRAGAAAVLSDTDFVQAGGEGRYITSLDERQRLLFRAAVGATWVDDFDQLPPELRYFAGGDTSLRGYGYQDLGPRNTRDRVVGGPYLLTASAEYEYALDDRFAVAAFVDAGNAFDSHDATAEVGVGLGLRWRSPVGLVRLDIGFPLDDFGAPRPHLVIGPDL